MIKTFRYRSAGCAIAFGVAVALSGAAASADLQTVVGARVVVPNEPVSSCGAKAKTALNSVLQNAIESEDGSGEWLAYGALDSAGHASAAASIHCYPVDTGYVVTFACAAQVPPNPDTATGLCAKLVAAFPGAKAAARDSSSAVGRLP
ncbi:MAG TPA: hypothetical protein VGF86_14845 [Candidatus Tumulicola sp.]